jgi:hypothetical protein
MAEQEQLEILMQGADVWNKWREENPSIEIDLSNIRLKLKSNLSKVNLKEANLREAMLVDVNLREANLSLADLTKANLRYADLSEANLNQADLREADLFKAKCLRSELIEASLYGAHLRKADFTEANLEHSDLREANLSETVLYRANLIGAHFIMASLIGTKIDKARISKSRVYAVNVWDIEGEFDEQNDLILTPYKAPIITVDNIKVAQFIYLILNNSAIRDVINTITSKSVLILGRFAIPERKTILDALKNKLREFNLLPIVFDFDRPIDKDFTETIKTLAGLSYFVIADVTNPKSSPLELQATVPDYQIPFVPIIQEGEKPFSMMVDLQKKYSWVLNTVSYDSKETLMEVLKPLIIDPAMRKRQELRIIKAQEPEIISAKDYLAKGKE